MIKEFGNCTDDSNDASFGQYEAAGPSNVLGRDVGDDDSDDSNDGDDEEDPEENPEEESDGDKT